MSDSLPSLQLRQPSRVGVSVAVGIWCVAYPARGGGVGWSCSLADASRHLNNGHSLQADGHDRIGGRLVRTALGFHSDAEQTSFGERLIGDGHRCVRHQPYTLGTLVADHPHLQGFSCMERLRRRED